MKNKLLSLSGIAGSIIALFAYLLFSSLNPDYNDLTQAFSRLSSVGQPHALQFSILGFIIPGILIFIFSLYVSTKINKGEVKKYPFVLIALSALLMALGGFPMDYSNYSSPSSLLHIFGVMSSGLVFMIGGFTISKQLKKDTHWKPLIKPLLLLVWLLIVSGFFRSSAYSGLAQKIGILAYYAYVSLLSWKAYKLQQQNQYSFDLPA